VVKDMYDHTLFEMLKTWSFDMFMVDQKSPVKEPYSKSKETCQKALYTCNITLFAKCYGTFRLICV